eukprot:scaffold439_cov415-Prasinococcus_capsulatus_cf.AAC.23
MLSQRVRRCCLCLLGSPGALPLSEAATPPTQAIAGDVVTSRRVRMLVGIAGTRQLFGDHMGGLWSPCFPLATSCRTDKGELCCQGHGGFPT